MKLRFSMAHFSLWQRSPLRNSLVPSRRHYRQTGPMYLAKFFSFTFLPTRCGLQPWQAFFPLTSPAFVAGRTQAGRARPLRRNIDPPPPNHTLRFLGGRQPLCGIGVTSRMVRTSMPAVDKARTADSRPEPGPLTRTSTVLRPLSEALLAAVMAACCAANGVPLREPRKPSEPALDQEMVLPSRSAMVTMVLLKVAWICTIPLWTTRFSFFLKLFFLPAFAGAFAITMFSPPLSSYSPPFRGVVLCACARWYGCAGPAPAGRGGAATRDRSPSRCDA